MMEKTPIQSIYPTLAIYITRFVLVIAGIFLVALLWAPMQAREMTPLPQYAHQEALLYSTCLAALILLPAFRNLVILRKQKNYRTILWINTAVFLCVFIGALLGFS